VIEGLVRADHALYRFERAVVAAVLGVMGLVVFLDVAHRVSTRSGSWLADPLVIAVVAAVVAVLGFRTRGASQSIVKGLVVGVGVAAAQWVFVKAVPNGLVWSQPMALGLTLWLGTIGASLAAHERRHLALDIGSKLWPESMVRTVAALGHACTAVFCVLVLGLAMRSVGEHFALWRETGGAAGNLSGASAVLFGTRVMIPTWLAALAIPYGMAMLAFRFSLEAVRVATGRIAVEVDELAQLGIQTEPKAEEAS